MHAESAHRPPAFAGVRPGLLIALVAVGLLTVFATLVLFFHRSLREESRRQLVERDAAVLHPIALRQLALAGASETDPSTPLRAALRSADQAGMFAMAVFDGDGALVQAVPPTLPFPDLAPADYLRLTTLAPLSRYHPDFSLREKFGAAHAPDARAPVLEIALPLHRAGETRLAGIAQYWIDGRGLARELAAAERRLDLQAAGILGCGAAVVALGAALSYWRLARAQREIAERTARLSRAQAELTLAAKASVLGQITTHLLHGLQGPLAGLRTVMNAHGAGGAEDWQTASDYTLRLQSLIQQTVALLDERRTQLAYELGAAEIAAALRERHAASAAERHVELTVLTHEENAAPVSGARGSLLCLVAANLIDNALAASPAGAVVRVTLHATATAWRLSVVDAGPGLPDAVRADLFQPGRSTKPGGTGLGLALSQLMARHVGAELHLVSTGPHGTTFEIVLPTSALV